MMRSAPGLALAGLLAVTLTAIVTWPQALDLSGSILGHHDTYFSIWRIAWIAHGLSTSPLHLFDANIFSPATGTLTYSDAMLLQGVVAAPFLWAGLPAPIAYNALLAIGYTGSGVAMFVLARHLTGQTAPALVAVAGFTLAPYRTEHVMHLELQWAMWIPLTLWAVHRTFETTAWRWGAIAGLFFALQTLSCVYYGVFLAMLLTGVVPLLLITSGTRGVRAVPALAISAAVASVLVLPYAWSYAQTSQQLGARDMREIVQYSAQPLHYVSSPMVNRLWGWTADRFGGNETRLFPGLIVVALALVSLGHRSRRWVFIYASAATLAVLLSFGVHNSLYRWLFDHVSLLRGLRASARFAIVVSAMLSVLAAFGAQLLTERVRKRQWVVPLLLALMTLEGLNQPFALTSTEVTGASSVYKVIRSSGDGVVVELPLPTLARLPGWDAYYSLWSLQHWHPLVNGYSGYYPPDYMQTMVRMESFPDDASIARLKAHHVRYLVVHKAFLDPERYASVLFRIATRPEFKPWGTYRDALDDAVLFVMEP